MSQHLPDLGSLQPQHPIEARFLDRLKRLDHKHRLRRLALGSGLDLSSNDYLGLSGHPGIRAAVTEALTRGLPLSASGSRLLRGNFPEHQQLEQRLARFKGSQDALLFNSGYDANVGLLQTICSKSDLIFSDSHNHASILDGIAASRATRVDFAHNNLTALAQALASAPVDKQKFIVVESVYSMDGDLAPLASMADLAKQFGAYLIVDEAHATGLFGPGGAGLVAALDDQSPVLATVHTGGKALGAYGAFITCSTIMKQYLINTCRKFIFTTALPPLIAVQLDAVLNVIAAESWRRERVLALADQLRQAWSPHAEIGTSESPIVPVILGTDQRALEAAAAFREQGFDVRAIRPPTVPRGTARLRFSLSASLRDTEMAALISTGLQILKSR